MTALGDTWIDAVPFGGDESFLTAAQHLFLIMPRRSIDLLPLSYRTVAERLYPTEVATDNRFSVAQHDQKVLLPFWDTEEVVKELRECELTGEEQERMGSAGKPFRVPDKLLEVVPSAVTAAVEDKGQPLLSRRQLDVGTQFVTGKTAVVAAASKVEEPKNLPSVAVSCEGCEQLEAGCFASDCDEEMVVSFAFSAVCRVSSLRIERLDNGVPLPVRVAAVLNNSSVGCDDVTGGTAKIAHEWRLDWSGGASCLELALPAHLFQRVSVLSLYFAGPKDGSVGVRLRLS